MGITRKTKKVLDKLEQEGNISEVKTRVKKINSRDKGHNFERDLMNFFKKELGYDFAKTSRYGSRMLDDCKVDLSGIPFLVQAKNGYAQYRPKADEIFKQIKEELKKNYPKDDPIHSHPKLLIHKMDGRVEEGTLVTMTFKDFKKMMLSSPHNLGKNKIK